MTINERVKTALAEFELPVKPDRYSGDSESYFVFNYTTSGAMFADNAPGYDIYLVQVHYFCPMGVNTITTRKRVKQLLHGAGFTWPEETNVSDSPTKNTDDDKQHIVFECEIEEGIVTADG